MSEKYDLSEKCTFELLSAYLDGEVDPSQRQQVQNWLTSDPEVKKLYQRLQVLRNGFQNLPTPEAEYSPQDLSKRVFAHIDQERKIRKRWLWGGGAIAAMFVAAVGSIFSESNTPVFQFVQQPEETESLIIALNRPLIDIPAEKQAEETESLMIPIDHSLMEIPDS
jgi:anti-sigma factor RsiW